MSDSFIQFNTTEQLEKFDTRKEETYGEHRQVVVLGDPAANSNVAQVTSSGALKVEVQNQAQAGSQVEVTNFPATQAVSLAAAPLTPVSDNNGSLTIDGAVSVSNLPSVQPVSDNNGSLTVDGAVSVSNFPASQPVTIASMPTTPVTGTFWQATQPISGTVTSNAGTGTFATRDLKDTGRQHISVNWEEMTGTANVESALTNYTSASRNGTALGAANNLAVTAGKTLRIQEVGIYIKQTSTVSNVGRFRIRQAATVANNSPIIFDRVLPGSAAGAVTANSGQYFSIPIPGGIEVVAGQQITFTWLTSANTCTVGMMITGYEY